MKRFLAMVLVLCTVFSLCLPLAGCGKNPAELKMGIWLGLMSDSFGMSEYRTSEPYFAKVPSDDPAFGVFQMAAEWDILEPDATITSDQPVTWKDALVTLVNCGRFLTENATEEEKIEYAIATFDPEIREYWMNRNITMEQAVTLLDKAQQLWANKTFPDAVEELELADDVLDLLDEDIDYDVSGNVVTLDASLVEGLGEGDYYTLPGKAGETEGSLNKIQSIEIEDGVATIINEDELSDEDIMDKIVSGTSRGSEPVDFGNIVAIYDAYGRPIYSADTGIDTALTSIADDAYSNVQLTTLENAGSNVQAQKTGFFSDLMGKPLTLDLGDGLKGTISFTSNSASLKLERSRAKDSKYRNMKETTYIETSISDVKLNKDVNMNGFKVSSAYMTLDYKTSVSAGMKYSETNKVGTQLQDGQMKKTHLSTIVSGYANAVGNLKKQVYQTKYSNNSIYICRFTVAGNGFAGVDFIMRGNVTASGTVELTLSMQGTRGVEYVNGNLRCVGSNQPGVEAKMEGNFEITMELGFEARVLKSAVGSATIEAGVGASLSSTAYLIDEEWHQLYSGDTSLDASGANDMMDVSYQTTAEDILAAAEAAGGSWKGYTPDATVNISARVCIDWKMYPILKIHGRIDAIDKGVSKTFFDSENIIMTGHIDIPNNLVKALEADGLFAGFKEFFGVNAKCSYEFKPWDEGTGETTETNAADDETKETFADDENIMTADAILLSTQRIFMEQNQTSSVSVTGLPKGYSLGDLVVVYTGEQGVSVNLAAGTVTSKDATGTFTVIIKTSDGKYDTPFAVTVSEPAKTGFVGVL